MNDSISALPSTLDRLTNPSQDAKGPLAEPYPALLDGLRRALVTAGNTGVLASQSAAELLAGLQAVQQIARKASQSALPSGSSLWSYTLESIPLGGYNLALRCETPQWIDLGFQIERDFYLHGILSLLFGSGQDEQVFSFDLEQAKDGWVLRHLDREQPVQVRLELPADAAVPWKSAAVFDFLAPLLSADLSAGADWLETEIPSKTAPLRQQPETPAEALSPAMAPTLIYQPGPVKALALVVNDRRLTLTARFTIGRGAGNDLRLEDPKSSRYHAVIERVPGGWLIRDLTSANGTWLNGSRISAPTMLKAGDSLVMGLTKLDIVASA